MYTAIIIFIFICLYIIVMNKHFRLNKLNFIIISGVVLTFTIYAASMERNSEIGFSKFTNRRALSELSMIERNSHVTKHYEKDVVKNVLYDEDYIYTISNHYLKKVDIKELKVTNETAFQEKQVFKLFQTDDLIVTIGSEKTRVVINFYEKSTLQLTQTIETHSTYIKSILRNNRLYVVTSQSTEKNVLPSYQVNGETVNVDIQDIYQINHTYTNHFVNVFSINFDDFKVNTLSFLGLGQVIYFSDESVYFAEEAFIDRKFRNNTVIIKVALDDLRLEGVNEVNGLVFHSSSLNEYKDQLRVFASSLDSNNVHHNHLYILNLKLDIIGSLKNFSVGNQIQAVSYIKDLAYIENYQDYNPLYILKAVDQPQIKNTLYLSTAYTYLKPVEEHIIAIGYVLSEVKDEVGIEVALYDVSNPLSLKMINKDELLYRDYNRLYSEALYDEEKFYVDEKHKVLGIPIIYTLKNSNETYQKQMILVYSYQNELKNLGSISHYTHQSMNKIIDIMVIGDLLYTVSNEMIKVYDIKTLELVNEVEI